MYRVAEGSDRIIGYLSLQEVKESANKYGENRGKVNKLEDDQDVVRFIKDLNINPDQYTPSDLISITSKVPYDYLVQTHPRSIDGNVPISETIGQIAKKMNEFVTKNSFIAEQVHPLLKDVISEQILKKAAGGLHHVPEGQQGEFSWESRILKMDQGIEIVK